MTLEKKEENRLECIVKEAMEVTNIVDPDIIKAVEDIFETTIFSIHTASIDMDYVKNSSYEKMIKDLRDDVSDLKRQIVDGKMKKYGRDNGDIELGIDMSIKDIVVDLICIQIKRGKMGHDV